MDYEGWPEVTEAIEVVCEELKQKPAIAVLQEIRQEIAEITPRGKISTGKTSIDVTMMIPLDKVLEIMDRHIKEIEHDT